MFARMSDKDGIRLFEVNLQDSLSADDMVRIESSIMEAHNAEPAVRVPTERAKWELRMWKAAKRRRRRAAKHEAKAKQVTNEVGPDGPA